MERDVRAAVSRAAAALVRAGAALALLAGLACGGGGGGSPSEPPPPTATPPPPPGVSLAVTTPQGAAITVARGARSTAALLVLEVRAESVTGLYGAAFDLLYPDALFDYQARVPGPFLGADVSAQVFESSAGNLVVGVTRVGSLPGVDGSGVLLELELAVRAAGSGEIAFARRSAHAADGVALPVGWGSATATVRQ